MGTRIIVGYRTFKEFLEKVPPGQEARVSNVYTSSGLIGAPPPIEPVSPSRFPPPPEKDQRVRKLQLTCPKLYLYCDHEECNGMRNFAACSDGQPINDRRNNNLFITYICQNCKKSVKIFAIRLLPVMLQGKAKIFKYGESPSFGPPTPPRAITLIRPDRELFFAGRRAENQGMGIGAFVYYRRVVENQKNSIFDAIIRVIKKTDPANPIIQDLEKGKLETQFTKAVEGIKHALPQSLFIYSQNPLTLLHTALSKGVHNHADAECLEIAGDIRVVLFEFAEKLGQALKEDAVLESAVKRLADKKKNKVES